MNGFFSSPISANISETEDGYLICHGVRLARTGMQEYRKSELPDKDAVLWPELGDSDIIRAWKTKDELFHPDTISSYNGKPVTDLHPPNLFDVTEHDQYDCGHVLNPRAGEQQETDGEWYLYGDLMLTDQELANKVRGGYMRQVSCGARNDFIRREDGDGEQVNIRGNHVAVVPKGRAGPLAGIRDHDETQVIRERSMTEELKNLLGLGIRERAKTAQPEELAGLLMLNLNTKPYGTIDSVSLPTDREKAMQGEIDALKASLKPLLKGTKDADDDEGESSETDKLHAMIDKLTKQVAELTKQSGKAQGEDKADEDDDEDESDDEGTEDADKDDDKKDKKDDDGTKDAEIEIPGEKKKPLDRIKAAGSMDAVMELKPLAIKSKSVEVKKEWNKKYHAFKKQGTQDAGGGTRDDYAVFQAAARARQEQELSIEDRNAKAQANYDSQRAGKK